MIYGISIFYISTLKYNISCKGYKNKMSNVSHDVSYPMLVEHAIGYDIWSFISSRFIIFIFIF